MQRGLRERLDKHPCISAVPFPVDQWFVQHKSLVTPIDVHQKCNSVGLRIDTNVNEHKYIRIILNFIHFIILMHMCTHAYVLTYIRIYPMF